MAEPKPHRRKSVHHSLGGGLVADVLLWKNWCGGIVVLVSATALWLLFERVGYNVPLPPLPDLKISEQSSVNAADTLQVWINHALSIAHDIAIERNWVLFVQITSGLWVISYIGSVLNVLTLIYIVVLLSLSVPLLYDKYQDQINDKLHTMHGIIQTQYKRFNIPIPLNKEKKME
ncbi:reticulon-like protein B11 [Senna tora]|uniref:Reticulon-like protein n=1 Tax=Senna tora TaxID=362788 RepID=A0A834W7A4_9FABA|nr:reticulon-like protein B11 [Senna tora]